MLSLCIILPYLNGFTLAAQMDGQQGLCEHHPVHTADCGYVEAVEGRPCAHVHSGECGYVEGDPGAPCTHEHTEDCYVTACVHVHDDSCYAAEEPPADTGTEPDTGETPPPAEDGEEKPVEPDGEEVPLPAEDGEEGPVEPDGGEVPPPVEDGEEEPAEPEGGETASPAEIEDGETPLAELPEDREPVNCAHRCTAESGCVTLRCAHKHDENCGYIAPTEAFCAHVHDETCGYAEAVEGQPCRYECQLCGALEVLSWSWADWDEALVYSEETAAWGLAFPGASEENPLTAAVLAAFLPAGAEVELSGGRETVPVSWDLSGVPEEGVWEGTFFVYGALPEEYRLGEGVPVLAVLVDLGGGETMALVANPKFLNDWAFVSAGGEDLPQDNMPEITVMIPDLNERAPNEVRQILTGRILPRRLSGWVPTDTNGRLDAMINKGMFEKNEERTDPFEEMTADGKKPFRPLGSP